MSCEDELARVEWEIGYLTRTIPNAARFVNANYATLATLQGMLDTLRGQLRSTVAAGGGAAGGGAAREPKAEEARGVTGGGEVAALVRDIEDMERRLDKLEAR